MQSLPVLTPGKLSLLVAPRAFLKQAMPPLIARQALSGRLHVLDGGNCFNAYGVSRALRRQSHQMPDHLENIMVARAFTCYQVVTLLSETWTDGLPVLALELLATFYDENVRISERRRLLEHSLAHLQRLSRSTSVAITANIPPPTGQEQWLRMLEESASQVWQLEGQADPHTPPLL
jgi:hypothetical protein